MNKSELANQAYRASILVNIDKNGNFTAEENTVTYSVDKDLLVTATLHTMPEGLKPEIWHQTESTYSSETGFRALAWIRHEPDGKGGTKPYLENGQPQIMLAFPGNTGTDIDRETSKNIVAGKEMFARYAEVQKFTEDVAEGMRERAETNNHDLGKVTIAMHSIGALALGAGLELEERLDIETQSIFLEPVGAGQALQQWATFKTEQRHENDQSSTLNEATITAEHMAKNAYSILSDDSTFFRTDIGDENYDKAAIGKTYTYKSPDSGSLIDQINDHLTSSIASSLLENGESSLNRTKANDISTQDILSGGGDLSDWQQIWTQLKTTLLMWVQSLIEKFNAKPSLFNQVDPDKQYEHNEISADHAQNPTPNPVTPPQNILSLSQ